MHTETRTLPRWRQSRYGFAAFLFLTLLAVFTTLRLVLFLAFAPGGVGAVEAGRIFLIGIHRDVFVALLYLLPLLAWFWLIPNRWFAGRWHRYWFHGVLFLGWLVQVFLIAAEFFFFEEFRSRFNTVAVDYVLYPHEVFINIWDSYPVLPVVLVCGAASAIWLGIARRLFASMWLALERARVRFVWLAGALVLVAALSWTLSLKAVQLSRDRTLNEIANNGALSLACAAWTHHLDFAAFYKTLTKEEAYARVRRLLASPKATFVAEGQTIRRRMAGDSTRPRLNVVIILEESLGSEFWGCLGRKRPTLTPEMDRLAMEEGLLFTNLYASGNRTVRGFEGVLSSFPPLPGDAIVKRDLSDNVETIARVLKRDGYSTLFLYGGRGVFDAMRAFALRNGYDCFIEEKHFERPTFSTIWGVCDEDAFDRAIREFRELARQGKPFCATLLSVSNHKPYTYPAGRIPEDPNARKRAHAVKYSDFALGRFFRAARQEPFWTNTIFAVVADHGARVYGSLTIPVRSYEIPLVILGPAVVKAPARLPVLGCSLDVPTTILGLLGRPYESLFFGRDLLEQPAADGRVLVNHNRDIGLLTRERLVVLGLRNTVEFYAGDPKQGELKPIAEPAESERELERDAVALFQVADDLYTRRRFRIDADTPQTMVPVPAP
jgi:phosphoglycerol transferase MdoB-like AlkP superfamily enzyme